MILLYANRQTLRVNLESVVRITQPTMFLGVIIHYLLFLGWGRCYEVLIWTRGGSFVKFKSRQGGSGGQGGGSILTKNWLTFLLAGKHQSFLQGATNIFGWHVQAYQDSQTNFRILQREISHKGFDGLPWFVTKRKTGIFKDEVYKAVRGVLWGQISQPSKMLDS